MYKLMVSRSTKDKAIYKTEMFAEDLEDFNERMDKLDIEGVRWIVADDTGQLIGPDIRICKIHKNMLFNTFSKQNGQAG